MVVESEIKRAKHQQNLLIKHFSKHRKYSRDILLLQSLCGSTGRRFMAPYAQKSSTVSNLEMSRRLACHVLLLSFLKNHRDHLLGRNTEKGNLHKCNKALIKQAVNKSNQKPSELRSKRTTYGCTSRHKLLTKS